MITSELPFWQLNPEFASSVFQRFTHDLVRCAVAILPATALWGASFPLALAAVATRGQEPGHLAGGINAANTIGAIAGALVFGLAMIPMVGTSISQQILAGLAGCAALLIFGTHSATAKRKERGAAHAVVATAVIAGLVLLAIQGVPPVSGIVIANGRHAHKLDLVLEEILFVGEGRSSSIAVIDSPSSKSRSIHVGGKVMASTVPEDMRLQRMMGHLPALLHPNPKTALVVGFGTGITAGSLLLHPEIERVVICEIEPLMLEAGGQFFASENYDVVDDPRVEVIYDDARHFIATTEEEFDIITSDPFDPWMDGAAVLYSVEYYELAKKHLRAGGIAAQWVQLYEIDELSIKSMLASFMRVFPLGTVWSTHIPRNGGSDLMMVGSADAMEIDVKQLAARIERNPRLAQSLEDVDLGYFITLLSTYFARGPDLEEWLEDAQINRERSLRLQYFAGFSVETYELREIYRAMVPYRQYPKDILIAPPEIRQRVEARWRQ
jgi:spermidine synthase